MNRSSIKMPPPQQQTAAENLAADFDYKSISDDMSANKVVQGTPLYKSEYDYGKKGVATETGAERFVVSGWQDLWAAVLFAANICFIGYFAFANRCFNTMNPLHSLHTLSVTSVASLVIEAFAGSAFTITALLGALYRWPQQIILTGGLVCGSLITALGLTIFLSNSVVIGGVTLFFGITDIVITFMNRHHIPQAAVLIVSSINVITQYWGTIVAGLGGLGISAIFLIVWHVASAPTFAEVATILRHLQSQRHSHVALEYPDGTAIGPIVVVLILFIFSALWTTHVIIHTVQVITAGTVASWYYIDASQMPRSPTLAALRRALTTSFGTVCFGSIVVVIFATIRCILLVMRNYGVSHNVFVLCVVETALGCIEGIMVYVNVYAFTHIAIYGTSYLDSARDVLSFLSSTGWDAIINDKIVWPIIAIVNVCGAAVVGLGVGVLHWNMMWGMIAFLIAYIAHIVVIGTVYASIVTLFVCYAESPEVAERTQPSLSAQMSEVAMMHGLYGHV